MTRSSLVVCSLVLLAAPLHAAPVHIAPPHGALPTRAAPPRTPAHLDMAPGVVLVAERSDAPLALDPGGRLSPSDPGLAAVLARHGLDAGEVLGVPPAASAYRFLLLRSAQSGFDPRAAADDLRATGAFRAVSPDYRLKLLATLPNDPDLASQWYVDSGTGVDIKLPLAWDSQKGSASVIIAILDTGIDTGHPDLASKIWHNPGEIAGNGIDDDGNGYIDDTVGWDFGNNDNDPNPEPVFDAATGIDVGFHGTFCAGIAAAATNNGEGIAGAAWNCRIMDLKISDTAGNFPTSAITAGMEYAAKMGASVLSMSFGGPGDPGVPEYFQALVDMENAAGVVCVAAAGNDGSSAAVYPAACHGVIAVAATDETGGRASFSNWGPTVTVAAPGQDMWSSICRNYVVDDYSQVFYEALWLWDGVTPYMYGDGTSFSTPLTAGVCALIRSFAPNLTPPQVATQLVASGDRIAFDLPIGPRVDAYNAVNPAQLAVAAEAPPARLAIEPARPNPFRDRTVIGFTLPSGGPVRLALYDCAGRRVRTLLDGPASAGRSELGWDGRDTGGAALAAGVYFARLETASGMVERKLVRLGR